MESVSDVYQNRICKFCDKEKTCPKDKFRVMDFMGKVTYRCNDYKYVPEDK